MTKKDKLIIEIEYDHSPVHFTDAEMEDAVNNYAKRILIALQDVRNPLYARFMAMARIEAKNIVRQANVSGSFCSQCGKMKKEAYSEEKVERCDCKNFH